jgi:hypothetical protein
MESNSLKQDLKHSIADDRYTTSAGQLEIKGHDVFSKTSGIERLRYAHCDVKASVSIDRLPGLEHDSHACHWNLSSFPQS